MVPLFQRISLCSPRGKKEGNGVTGLGDEGAQLLDPVVNVESPATFNQIVIVFLLPFLQKGLGLRLRDLPFDIGQLSWTGVADSDGWRGYALIIVHIKQIPRHRQCARELQPRVASRQIAEHLIIVTGLQANDLIDDIVNLLL